MNVIKSEKGLIFNWATDLSSAMEDLNGLESELEELRRNNSDLRKWGENLADAVDKIRDVL